MKEQEQDEGAPSSHLFGDVWLCGGDMEEYTPPSPAPRGSLGRAFLLSTILPGGKESIRLD